MFKFRSNFSGHLFDKEFSEELEEDKIKIVPAIGKIVITPGCLIESSKKNKENKIRTIPMKGNNFALFLKFILFSTSTLAIKTPDNISQTLEMIR